MDRNSAIPLGRKLIKLTVDAPAVPGTPRRGYRRIQWIERAIAPLRDELTPARFERLVSQLASSSAGRRTDAARTA